MMCVIRNRKHITVETKLNCLTTMRFIESTMQFCFLFFIFVNHDQLYVYVYYHFNLFNYMVHLFIFILKKNKPSLNIHLIQIVFSILSF